MRLSVIIPARNEELRLPLSLDAVASHSFASDIETEVIVVDAGSSDSTSDVALSYSDRIHSLRVIRVEDTGSRNNKGLAIRTGMLAATGDLRCFIDADNGAPFEQIETLLPRLRHFDVVIGSRYIPGGEPGPRGLMRQLISRGGNLVFRLALGLRQRDTHCPLKLYSASAAQRLFALSRIDGLGFDVEILVIAGLLKLRVTEVPVKWHHVEGSSVTFRTILESFAEVIRIRQNVSRHLYDDLPSSPSGLPSGPSR